jgi:hypothetical protein
MQQALVTISFEDVPCQPRPVGVATEDTEHYKVGVSPPWCVGKKVLGFYLPWRLPSGETQQAAWIEF